MISLEGLAPEVLAGLCKMIAEHPNMDAATADKAWELKKEWLHLALRGPGRGYKENDKIVADERAHAKRMVVFLQGLV